MPGVVSTSQLPILLASVQEELDNSEWAVRKAAADTLACMATAAGSALVSHKGGGVAALENSRFDKVSLLSPRLYKLSGCVRALCFLISCVHGWSLMCYILCVSGEACKRYCLRSIAAMEGYL